MFVPNSLRSVPASALPGSVAPIRFRHAALRNVLRLFEIVAMVGAPAILSATFTRDNQRLGDLVAGTIVLLLGVMTVIGTLISDILLVWIDPRIRLEDT